MTTIIGANAMIGMVCEATIQGISDFSRTFRLTMRIASPMPSAEPIAKPSKVSCKVMRAW